MRTQKVSLVGAGPGDPGLLTLKAQQCLREADLVIYDFLANPEHLLHARPDTQKICVGKRFRHRLFSQKRINRLIVRSAQSGKRVVRLKGGDPYLFGRGGEEALFLQHHNIPFEVVPGVTSATACAAYAGVPLTHREHNASVTFLTGHRAHDRHLDGIDWKSIAALRGTIVVYMGFYNLARIAERLIDAGLSASTRVCVIEWGTLARQRSCDGSLATIAGQVKKHGLCAPAIIIIGKVVSLRSRLGWFEKLPLFGRKIVVTRMRDKAGVLSAKIRELGGEPIEFPVVQILGPSSFRALDRAICSLDRYTWIGFTSAQGVETFFERLRVKHGKDARSLAGIRIAAVGPETSSALLRQGVRADLQPGTYDAAALGEVFAERIGRLDGQRVLLARADIANPALERRLRQLGAEVDCAEVYRTRPVAVPAQTRRRMIEVKPHAVTFASGSAVDGWVRALGLRAAKKMSKTAKFVSIGPMTTTVLKKYGLRVDAQAKTATLEGLAMALKGCL